jgi:hypothetical protein
LLNQKKSAGQFGAALSNTTLAEAPGDIALGDLMASSMSLLLANPGLLRLLI